MANFILSNNLVSNSPGNLIADAANIAYSTKTVGSGPLAYEAVDESIKDKIDLILASLGDTPEDIQSLIDDILSRLEELSLTASNIDYTYTTEDGSVTKKLNVVLDEILSLVNLTIDIGTPSVNATYYTSVEEYNSNKGTSITAAEFNSLTQAEKLKTPAVEATGLYKIKDDAQSSATTATNQATLAINAANSAATSLTSIATEKTNAINAIKEEQGVILTNLRDSLDRLDSVELLTNKLITAFDISEAGSEGKANFVVLSENAYNERFKNEDVNDNVVYFVYSADEKDEDYCIVTVLRSNDSMGYVTGGGSYKKGSDVTLLAAAKEGYKFSGWTILGSDVIIHTDTEYQITPFENVTYYALFCEPDVKYTMLTSAGVGGTVSVSDKTDDNKYIASSILTITAIPNDHYSFKNWTYTIGGTVSSDELNPKSITINKDITYIANFVEDPKYNIILTCDSDLGTVTGGGEGIYKDTSITIIAFPKEGYQFVNWTLNGEEISPLTNYTFNVSEDVEYVANFIQVES